MLSRELSPLVASRLVCSASGSAALSTMKQSTFASQMQSRVSASSRLYSHQSWHHMSVVARRSEARRLSSLRHLPQLDRQEQQQHCPTPHHASAALQPVRSFMPAPVPSTLRSLPRHARSEPVSSRSDSLWTSSQPRSHLHIQSRTSLATSTDGQHRHRSSRFTATSLASRPSDPPLGRIDISQIIKFNRLCESIRRQRNIATQHRQFSQSAPSTKPNSQQSPKGQSEHSAPMQQSNSDSESGDARSSAPLSGLGDPPLNSSAHSRVPLNSSDGSTSVRQPLATPTAGGVGDAVSSAPRASLSIAPQSRWKRVKVKVMKELRHYWSVRLWMRSRPETVISVKTDDRLDSCIPAQANSTDPIE